MLLILASPLLRCVERMESCDESHSNRFSNPRNSKIAHYASYLSFLLTWDPHKTQGLLFPPFLIVDFLRIVSNVHPCSQRNCIIVTFSCLVASLYCGSTWSFFLSFFFILSWSGVEEKPPQSDYIREVNQFIEPQEISPSWKLPKDLPIFRPFLCSKSSPTFTWATYNQFLRYASTGTLHCTYWYLG